MSKNIIALLIVVFLLGAGVGFSLNYLKSDEAENKKEIMIVQKDCADTKETVNYEKSIQELDLLKDYINFILLPKEKIGNIDEYVANMNKKADEIGDEELSKKYSATGEETDKEQKILDFFNFSIEKVKAELEK